MTEKQIAVVVPEVPPIPGLPESVKKEWRGSYEAAYRRAQADSPTDIHLHGQTALKEANRLLRVAEIASYAEAMELADWQVLVREEKDAQLRVLTIDGRKYRFDVPARAKPAAADGEKKGGEKKKE